ncbi:MAG: type II toxin-antitoxin system VapC family toxin [Thermoproteota archaeon]
MDTSALLAPFQLGIDFERWIGILVDSKVEIFVLRETLAELEALSSSFGKLGSDASKALVLAGRYRVISSPEPGDVDECLIKAAKRYNCAVATCDRSLKRRLRDLNIPVFSPTDRGKVRVEGLRP